MELEQGKRVCGFILLYSITSLVTVTSKVITYAKASAILHCTTGAACYYNLLLWLLQQENSPIHHTAGFGFLPADCPLQFKPGHPSLNKVSSEGIAWGNSGKSWNIVELLWKKCLPDCSAAETSPQQDLPLGHQFTPQLLPDKNPLKHTSSASSLHETPKKGDPKYPCAFVVSAKTQSFHF